MAERPPFARKIKDARDLRGITQGELGDKVGVEGDQISRWERGVQEPGLSRAVELCRALDISLDELAGLVPLGADLSGIWFASWQTWRNGRQSVNHHRMLAKHYGERVTFAATGGRYDVDGDGSNVGNLPDYGWYGDFRFSANHLKGDYRANEFDLPATGTMFLVLAGDLALATGWWTGITGEGTLGHGRGVLARTQQHAADRLRELLEEPERFRSESEVMI